MLRGAPVFRRRDAVDRPRRADIILEGIKKEKTGIGFDAQKLEFSDMFKAGIVDPLKVTRSALQNAASIASMLLTTEALVVEKPEEDKKMPAMPSGGGYEGMM